MSGAHKSRFTRLRSSLVVVLVAVSAVLFVRGSTTRSAEAAGSLGTVVPARLMETRSGPGNVTVDGAFEGIGRRAAGSVTELTVAGRGGVPVDAGSVMLNVTAVLPDAAGFLTVFPCGEDRPNASNVNYQAGDVVPNAVLAKIGADGKVCVFTLAAVDVVVDVNGFVPFDGAFGTVVPARLLETRSGSGNTTVDGTFEGIGRLTAGSVTELMVVGRGGVLDGAGSVMLNITAILPDAPGFLTVYPCGGDRPNTSNVNYRPGDVVPNAVLAKIGAGGKVCVYTLAAVDVVVDVNGFRAPNIDVVLDETAAMSKSIGADGGNLAGLVGGVPFELSIPAGALVSAQMIKVTPGLSISGSGFDDDLVSVVQFGPDGVQFQQPVTLTFEVPAGVDPADLIAFGYSGPGELFHLIPHSVEGSTVTIEMWHFSGAGIAAAKAAIDSIAVYQSAAGEVYSGQIGAYLDQLAAQMALGQDVAIDTAGVADLLRKWWDLGLAPTLSQTKQHPLTTFPGFTQSNAEMWIAEALNWEAVRQSLGVGPIDGIDVFTTVRDVADAAEAAANDNCVGGSDTAIAAQFVLVANWQAKITALGGPAALSFEDCAELVISSDVIPDEIGVDETGPGEFVIGLRFLGAGGQTRYSLPFVPNVTATGGSLTNIVGSETGLVTFTINQTIVPTIITANPTINISGAEFTTERTWIVQPAGIDVAALVGHWYGTNHEQHCASDNTTVSWGRVVQDGSLYYVDVFKRLHDGGGGLFWWDFVRLRVEAAGITAYLGKGGIYSDSAETFFPSSDTSLPHDGEGGDDYKAEVNNGSLTVIEIDTGHEGLYDDCDLARWTHTWEKGAERDPFGPWASATP
jgi:hypothetical protein